MVAGSPDLGEFCFLLGRGCICHTESRRGAGFVMRAAVLVSYFPDGDTLGRTIDSLLQQVDRLYWIDNGTSLPLPSLPASEKLTFIRLEHNVGIAAAQNIGIKAAINDGANFVLLSDQDTYFPAKTLENLVDTFQRWPNAAAVVPLFKDTHKKKDDGFILSVLGSFPRGAFRWRAQALSAIASGKVLKWMHYKKLDLWTSRCSLTGLILSGAGEPVKEALM